MLPWWQVALEEPISIALASEGSDVVVADINMENAEKVVAELQGIWGKRRRH